MGYQVQYRDDSGEQRREVATADAAVALIERLHADATVQDVRLFREVPVKVETVVKVSLEDADAPASPAAAPPPAGADAPADADAPPGSMLLGSVSVSPQLAAEADAEQRKGIFQRG